MASIKLVLLVSLGCGMMAGAAGAPCAATITTGAGSAAASIFATAD
jgi:hypothetical protein